MQQQNCYQQNVLRMLSPKPRVLYADNCIFKHAKYSTDRGVIVNRKMPYYGLHFSPVYAQTGGSGR